MRVFAASLACAILLRMASLAQSPLVMETRMAAAAGDWTRAEQMVNAAHSAEGATPDVALAESWIARGMLDAGRFEDAQKHAAKTREWALQQIERRKLDADAELPLALGASIEVQALALAGQGKRSEAVAFLRAEVAHWRQTSMRARIQKNLNLLDLEGKLAPPLSISQWTGDAKPQPLSALRGHPVLLFFWAHWCVDCKAEASVIQNIVSAYGPRGLVVVGPTMQYGYAAEGEDTTPEKETEWIEQTRRKYYARIGPMAVPISKETMAAYGVSTTPTLVLVDAYGIVRLYHPGRMSYGELAPQVAKLVSASHLAR